MTHRGTTTLWPLALVALCLVAGCWRTSVPPRPPMPEPDATTPDPEPTPEPQTAILQACPEGLIAMDEGCCWPGQSWDSDAQACAGAPKCPEPLIVEDDGCISIEDVSSPDALLVACKAGRLDACELGCLNMDLEEACGLAIPLLEASGASTLEVQISMCEFGNVEACMDVGDVSAEEGLKSEELDTADEARVHYDNAAVMYDMACEEGHAQGCQEAALSRFVACSVVNCNEDAFRTLIADQGDALTAGGLTVLKDRCISSVAEGSTGTCVGLWALTETWMASKRLNAAEADDAMHVACTGQPVNAGIYTTDPASMEACGALSDRIEARLKPSAGKPWVGFARWACREKIQSGCVVLGRNYRGGHGLGRDPIRAASLFENACNENHAEACSELAHMMERGQGVPEDPLGAADLYDRTCAAGAPSACLRLGKMLVEGRGVGKDAARGRTLIRKACEAGFTPACK